MANVRDAFLAVALQPFHHDGLGACIVVVGKISDGGQICDSEADTDRQGNLLEEILQLTAAAISAGMQVRNEEDMTVLLEHPQVRNEKLIAE